MSELVVIATVDGRKTAFAAESVRTIIDIDAIVPVPHAPAHVAGLAALRSKPITVIDACSIIGGAAEHVALPRRAIVTESEGHIYALMVEDVSDVVACERTLSSVGGDLSPGWQRVASGIVETALGPALLIDPDLLITQPAEMAA